MRSENIDAAARALTAREDALFDAWPVAEGGRVARDGCAHPPSWLAAPVRLVFILKEVNHRGSPDLDDLRQALREGPTSRQVGRWAAGRRLHPKRLYLDKTWDNVIRWVQGITADTADTADTAEPWATFSAAVSVRAAPELLRQICAVNLNKGGGGAEAKGKSIRDAARRDAARLRQQLALYPDVDFFICCGSNLGRLVVDEGLLPQHHRVVGSPGWRSTRRGVRYLDLESGATLIDYCHPQARVDDPLVVYPLIDAVRVLRGRTARGRRQRAGSPAAR